MMAVAERAGQNAGAAALVRRMEEYENARAEAIALMEEAEEQDEMDGSGAIWPLYKDQPAACRTLTGFPPLYIHELALDIIDSLARQRGKAPRLSVHDSILILLHIYRSGSSYTMIAAHLRLKPDTVRRAADSIRPVLHSVLERRHNAMLQVTLPRAQPLPASLSQIRMW